VAECDLATATLGESSAGVPEEKQEVSTDDMLKKDIYIYIYIHTVNSLTSLGAYIYIYICAPKEVQEFTVSLVN